MQPISIHNYYLENNFLLVCVCACKSSCVCKYIYYVKLYIHFKWREGKASTITKHTRVCNKQRHVKSVHARKVPNCARKINQNDECLSFANLLLLDLI